MSGRLRSYARLSSQSQKVKDGAHDFQAVYAEVDARSEGRCEWEDFSGRGEFWGASAFTERCRKRAVDKHHTVKPRRSHHDAALIIALCRGHHDRCEWPYVRGRGVVTALGGGRFRSEILFSPSKLHARGQGQ